MTVGGEKHAPDRGHVPNNGWNTSHVQKSMWLIVVDGDKVHNAYNNHLLEMTSINVGSKDSIHLQQSDHDVFKEM